MPLDAYQLRRLVQPVLAEVLGKKSIEEKDRVLSEAYEQFSVTHGVDEAEVFHDFRVLMRDVASMKDLESAKTDNSVEHQRAAMPVHITALIVWAIVTVVAIGAGYFAIARLIPSQTTNFDIWGFKVSTKSVAVALILGALGVLVFGTRAILKNIREIARIKK